MSPTAAIRAVVADPATPDLSMRQIAVLSLLRDDRLDRQVKTLACDLNVHKPAVTRALDRLEGLRFCRRIQHTKDRRCVSAQITSAGLKFLARIEGAAS